MTNEEYIKQMDTDQLARFINMPVACNEVCPDSSMGCAWHCEHNQGVDIIKEWLKEEVE